jgi:hypothetical protein
LGSFDAVRRFGAALAAVVFLGAATFLAMRASHADGLLLHRGGAR